MRAKIATLVLICGSICFGLLLVELGMRLAGIAYTGAFYRPDPDLGWSLWPNTEGWSVGEAKVPVRINSDGMRDREHSLRKNPGTIRIAVLGDSNVEGLSVPAGRTFPSVLERELQRCQARKVEVLNFGCSGYGTTQELIQLRTKAWKYSPDIVLLAFYPGNDITDNYRALNPNNTEQCPYYTLEDGRLVLDDSFRRLPVFAPGAARWQSLRAFLNNHSRAVQLLYRYRTLYRQRRAGAPVPDTAIYAPPRDPRLEAAWQVTEALIAAMNRDVAAHGARLWIVNLWTRAQVHPDPHVRAAVCRDLAVPDLSYADRRIEALAAREDIPVITLAPRVAAWAEQHREFVNGGDLIAPGEGHPNETGHRLAAEFIASDLCSAGLPGPLVTHAAR